MLAEQIKNKEILMKTIKELKKENPAADIQLLEKTIGALYLVEEIKRNNLNFIFKGGTSLVLLLNDLKRFSVDVDIITVDSKKRVKECFRNLMKNQTVFTRYEENKRNNSVSQRMDLEHYKFFFESAIDKSEKFILLDIAYEENKYPKVLSIKIENKKLGITSNI